MIKMSLLATFLMLSVATAAAPQKFDKINKQMVVDHVNSYRLQHRADPLTLDENLSNVAQNWANFLSKQSTFTRSSMNYGENLMLLPVKKPLSTSDVTSYVKNAVDQWYDEQNKYDYSSPVFSTGTRDFTQLVWKATRTVGIGYAMWSFKNNNLNTDNYYVAIVFEFSPKGNIPGAFRHNVSPTSPPLPNMPPALSYNNQETGPVNLKLVLHITGQYNTVLAIKLCSLLKTLDTVKVTFVSREAKPNFSFFVTLYVKTFVDYNQAINYINDLDKKYLGSKISREIFSINPIIEII